jgi:hypothetical protein
MVYDDTLRGDTHAGKYSLGQWGHRRKLPFCYKSMARRKLPYLGRWSQGWGAGLHCLEYAVARSQIPSWFGLHAIRTTNSAKLQQGRDPDFAAIQISRKKCRISSKNLYSKSSKHAEWLAKTSALRRGSFKIQWVRVSIPQPHAIFVSRTSESERQVPSSLVRICEGIVQRVTIEIQEKATCYFWHSRRHNRFVQALEPCYPRPKRPPRHSTSDSTTLISVRLWRYVGRFVLISALFNLHTESYSSI